MVSCSVVLRGVVFCRGGLGLVTDCCVPFSELREPVSVVAQGILSQRQAMTGVIL